MIYLIRGHKQKFIAITQTFHEQHEFTKFCLDATDCDCSNLSTVLAEIKDDYSTCDCVLCPCTLFYHVFYGQHQQKFKKIIP